MSMKIPKIASRAMFGVGAVAAALSASGAIYQYLATEWARRRRLPPGRMVDVDGVPLHLRDQGEGSPTVVLEAGLTSASAQWAWVQPEVAKFTRVVSYDRAGLGFSSPSDAPRDAKSTAERLHALLEKAGVPGPYVLAGHSLGGLFVRMFARLYPEEVAGLVLLDSVHPDQRMRWGQASHWRHTAFFGELMVASYLARVGVPRLSGYRSHITTGLPTEAAEELRELACTNCHMDATTLETAGFDAMCEQVRAAGGFGDLPLAVISGECWHDGWDEQWHSLQRELAALSAESTFQIVPGSNHTSLITNREQAMVTVRAIQRLVKRARAAQRYVRRVSKNAFNSATQSAASTPSTITT